MFKSLRPINETADITLSNLENRRNFQDLIMESSVLRSKVFELFYNFEG